MRMTDDFSKIAEDSARGSFFLISGSIVVEVVSALASILVSKFLGEQLYGQYVLALVVPQLLFLFADLGINQGLVKFSASLRARGEKGHIAQLIKYGMIFKALVGLIIFLVGFIFADFLAAILISRPDMAFLVRIASISIVFQVVLTTATSAFVGLDKTEYSAFATNIQAMAKAIISVSLVLLGFSVAGAVIGHVVGYLISGIIGIGVLFFLLKAKVKQRVMTDFSENIKTLIHYGAPLYVSALLTGFVLPYQNVILAIFTSDTDVGNFKVAQNFITLITALSIPIATALLPAFSKLNSTSNGKTKDFFKLATKYTTLLVIPIAVLLIIFSGDVVQVIYGSSFQSASVYLSMYAPIYFLVGIGYLTLTSLFNGLGGTRIVLKITLLNVLIFAVLAPPATFLYGVPGLIVALFISNTIGTSYGAIVAKKRFHIEFPSKSTIKTYIISAVASVPAMLFILLPPLSAFFNIGTSGFLNTVLGGRLPNVIAGGLLYLFTYASLIPMAGIINLSELEKAEEIIKKIRLLNFVSKPLMKYERTIISRQVPIDAAKKELIPK